ncbi:CBS domain-containing protein [Streptomyces sp. NPDC051219]|uniref:CBS domain-containing protein n=1 Tax=Streptomyces sp. NPDC051219 TaxID=3155283 RepID=UPI0034188CD0
MTSAPVTIEASTPIVEAARRMREADIGAVLVQDGEELRGVVTDRDLVVRALAEGTDPRQTPVGSVCSETVVTVSPGDDIGKAVELMREHAVRRLPVVDDGHAVGIVSLGDVAAARDPDSALSDISTAEPNA